MKSIFVLFFFVLLAGGSSFAQQKQPHSFEVKDGAFIYDGKPIQIYSGEMHYSRIPREYWRHRLKMVKAMGMNT